MSLVYGPFSQTLFAGASITKINSVVGWNQESSVVTVNLVEDTGQRFTNPPTGSPQTVTFEGFTFRGITQRVLRKDDVNGHPTYEVTLTDPTELLSGTQVILSNYRGNIGHFRNLLNAYGYWENKLGFGGSLINESGMVWNAPFELLNLDANNTGITITPAGNVGVLSAIHDLTKGINTNFGAPLRYFGYEYQVDLSGLPLPPSYYRVGGISASLLDIIVNLCQDGSCDFFCYLKGNTITFKTVSRARQPSPGSIANWINSRTDVISKSIGVEMANNVTNAILLGGDYTNLVQEYNPTGDDTIWPFWGFDIDGSVILGQGNPEAGQHTFHLNATPVADIVGSPIYPCDIPELRCALIDFDSWAAYVLKIYPDKAQVINLVSVIDSTADLATLFPDTIFTHDIIAESTDTITQFGQMNESDYWTHRAQRMYEFVRNYASEYFGRKFLVRIPFFIYWKMEPETTHVIASDEPTDGAFYPEAGNPLGIQFADQNIFLTPDGRFQCFVGYSIPSGNANIQALPPDSYVIENNTIYMKASIDTDIGIVYVSDSIYPYVVVTVDSPVYELANDALGNVSELAQILGIADASFFYATAIRHGSFPMKIHPAPYRPNGVAIPMKSNRDSYGPWFTTGGVDGRVSFERDEGLVPWNYGGIDYMNLAAQARLANAATYMQYQESGTVTFAGSPEHSLGDELVAGGAQVTNIDLDISTGGVVTEYRLQTYTPRFGKFTRENADRLRRLGIAAMQMRRALRNLFQREVYTQSILQSAKIGFMANTSRAVMQASPHACVLGTMIKDSQYGYRTQVSFCTPQEVIANMRGDNKDIWPFTGMFTLEGLLRPFSTRTQPPDVTGDNDIPFGDLPHYSFNEHFYPLTNSDLDPFGQDCDVDYMIWGDEYPGGVHTIKSEADVSNSRPIGLRMPLVGVGWGYTYTGKPTPNADENENTPLETDWGNEFVDKHRSKSELFKAGPIALFWDRWRGVWTIPTFLFGTIDVDPDTQVQTIKLDINGQQLGEKVSFINWLGYDLSAGQKVIAAYNQQENEWYILIAECV